MTRSTRLGALVAALAVAAPAAAQETPTQPKFQDTQPHDAASGATQAGHTRAGVTPTGEAADTAANAIQYPMLHEQRAVRSPTGERIGWISRVIAREGTTEAYAEAKFGDRKLKIPASKLRASGDGYVLDDIAFLDRAEPAS